jgi:lipopolysaccharide heptosyltransferase II
MRLRVSPEGREELKALLGPAPIRAGAGKLVALHPGATNGRAKQWPLPYWIDLARRLRGAGHTVVLCGGPDERQLAGAIMAGAGGAAGGREGDPGLIDLSGRTSLPALLALLEQADATVSGDSGPMHLAVAVDCPVLAIHGPTDPGQSGPYRARRAAVLRHDLPCSPCYRLQRVADCPLGHTLCQRLVTPEHVLAALATLLEP